MQDAATTPAAAATPGSTVLTPPVSPGPTAASPEPGVALQQPWATAALTNVSTGDLFRIADLVASGKVVFIETMAIWCTNCRAQQYEAVAAFERLDPSRAVWVGIDVETSESARALAAYAKSNGFPFTYAIADANLARALANDFGDIVLSPPSVNVIVIGTDGRVTQTRRGHKSADELISLAQEHGA